MGTAKRFWNWNAERYARQAISDEASYQKKLAITQALLRPDMNVAEFGCGTGSTAVLHAPKVKSYHAIDVSEKMIEIARGKAAEAGLSNLSFTVGTLEEARLPDGSCDAILGLNILHLVPDLDGTLASVSRALAPGGLFFSSTICARDLGSGGFRTLAIATRFLPLFPTVDPFTVAEFDAKLESAGFAIEERFDPKPGIVFRVARKS